MATIVDLVGYGTANYYEGGGATPTPSATASVVRKDNGCTETDNNNTDFEADSAPFTPRTSATTAYSCSAGDTAPAVTTTTPADGATGVAANTNITVTFSETVTITGTVQVSGASSGLQNVTPTTSDNLTFTLDPSTDFAAGELVTVTIDDLQVADQDANDPPNNMAADKVFSFTIYSPPVSQCGNAATLIHDVQGNTTTSPVVGQSKTIEGIVVGDFQNVTPQGDLNGFFVQEEDADVDADPATSEGVFVYEGSGAPLATVALGDKVRVTATVAEFTSGSITVTQLTSPTIEVCSTGNTLPTAGTPSLPMASATDFERYEGMRVVFSQKLTVTDHFTLARFGEVGLSFGSRLRVPTDAALPGAPAAAVSASNALNKITLDDALTTQNPDPLIHPAPGLSASNTVRGGDSITGLTGIMDQGFSLYRVQPAAGVTFTADNPRPAAAPAVGGRLVVAGMNLLNYYDTFTGCTNGAGGASTSCRGAENATEFNRQYPKTVAAILKIDPDVLGVNEIENDGYADEASAIDDLVDKLNAATAPGTYAYIDVDAETGLTNALGTDGIKVGMIYKPGSVTLTGDTAVLNTTAFVNGGDSAPRNRVSLLQAFEENATGSVFLVNINHLKSKGSACDDPDTGDGQGNCAIVRTNAATELTNWFATDPTDAGDADLLMLGDYNSYRKEDPIAVIEGAGYDNLIETLLGTDAYSYLFNGEWGYLDYAFASSTMAAQVSGVGEYHINADEPVALDYNTNFKSAGQIASFYAADEYRVSDHDPVVVGLNLDVPDTTAPDTQIDSNPSDPSNSSSAAFTFSSPDATATFECDLDGGGFSACTSPQNYTGLSDASHTFQVRAKDAAGNVDLTPASYTWTVDTTAPNTIIDTNPTDPTADNDPAFTFHMSDPSGFSSSFAHTAGTLSVVGGGFRCRLDVGAWEMCDTGSMSYTDVADGSHTFEVYAIDYAGNADPTPASFTWTIDTAAPDTQIDSNPPDPSNSSSASFTFSSPDGPTATFECKLDGGAFTPCSSPQNYTGLSDGPHTFAVRAVDAAGNIDPTPASFSWTIDTAVPDTQIDSNPSDPSNSSSAAFTFSSPDATATFECKLDGGAFTPCASPQNYTGLSDGPHTFQVRAKDAAGNVDPTPASFTWTINTSGPTPETRIYMSTSKAGTTGDGVPYFPEDILVWNGANWAMFFDGSAYGLTHNKTFMHNVNALYVPNDATPAGTIMSFWHNKRVVPGISGKVDGMDLVQFDGSTFNLWFDGQDVDLNVLTDEKIDGLHVLDGSLAPQALKDLAGGSCLNYLLLSTHSSGMVRIPGPPGSVIKFGGEDVLGFCMTQSGATTQGFWTKVLDGSDHGIPRNAIDSISADATGQALFLTTRKTFNWNTLTVVPSRVYRYDLVTNVLSGPLFDAPANGLPSPVDGLDWDGLVSICTLGGSMTTGC